MKALILNQKIVDVQPESFEVHPSLQWVDCPENCTPEWAFNEGVFTPPPVYQLSTAELLEQFTSGLKIILSAKANERDYDNEISCASYAMSTNLQWKAEAEAFIAWRDSCFVYAYEYLSDVEDGITNPNFETFISGLPLMQWPVI